MTHRVQRVQELIRRELGPLLDRTFQFPGCIATIHSVSLTPDFKQCFIYIGILGKAQEPETILRRLNEGRGIIQKDLYKRVKLKNSPTLTFKHDDSVERGVRIVNLIEGLPEPLPDEPLSPEDIAEEYEQEHHEDPPSRKRRK